MLQLGPFARMRPPMLATVMRSTFLSVLLSTLLSSSSVFAHSEPPKPCTIFSPFTGAYYDLNSIAVQPLVDHKPAHKDDRTESWHARGYDYGTNFTVNFCRPVIEDISDVVGVDNSLWKNISAYYKIGDKTFSIGYGSIVSFGKASFPGHCRRVLIDAATTDKNHQSLSSGAVSWF